MGKIEVTKLTEEKRRQLNIHSWPIWTKECSRFDWHYDETEACYILEGRVLVSTPEGEKIELGAGDYVIFPKGLSCTWEVLEPIKKHYNFM